MQDLLHFADVELDLKRCELRRAGRVIKLERIPMDLLVFLVEQRGSLVTREQIVERIWGRDTFIDTVNGVNTAVRKIRNALEDDPGNPRFIETVPGRGYRFRAPVTGGETPPTKDLTDAVRGSALLAAPTPAHEAGESFHIGQSPLRGPRLTHYRSLAAIALLAVLSLTTLLAFRLSPPAQLRVSSYLQLTSDGQNKPDSPLLSDGARIYFAEKRAGGTRLAAVAVAGGGTDVIPLLDGYSSLFDLSPPRWELLAGRPGSALDDDLWVLSPGKSPRRVGDLKANSANWSSDAQRLAFTLHDDVYIANADGSQAQRIAHVAGAALWPRWSPDGKRLRFTQNIYNHGEVWEAIWEVASDGSNLHRLLDGWNQPPHECCGSWTPDGKFYIFQSTHEGRPDIWAVSESRQLFGKIPPPVRLSSDIQGFSFPSISADGTQVFAVGTRRRGELVRFDSKLQEFVPFLGGISATWVSFTQSGTSVAYIAYPDQTLWRANADGTNKTQITFSPLQVDGFSWSPDEKWFAARARHPGKPWLLYLIPAKGGEPKQLTPGESEQGVPTWSADGARLAFGDVPEIFGKASGTERIHMLDLKTHTLSELPGSQGLWTARWSPDGRLIAALTIAERRLMLYDFATGKWRPTTAAHVNNLTWSKDCKYILFDTEGDSRSLGRVRVPNGFVDELVSLHTYPNLAWWWSGVALDNSPLILRNLGTTEIYSMALEYR